MLSVSLYSYRSAIHSGSGACVAPILGELGRLSYEKDLYLFFPLISNHGGRLPPRKAIPNPVRKMRMKKKDQRIPGRPRAANSRPTPGLPGKAPKRPLGQMLTGLTGAPKEQHRPIRQ